MVNFKRRLKLIEDPKNWELGEGILKNKRITEFSKTK